MRLFFRKRNQKLVHKLLKAFQKKEKGIRKLSQKFENYLAIFSQLSKTKGKEFENFPRNSKTIPPPFKD